MPRCFAGLVEKRAKGLWVTLCGSSGKSRAKENENGLDMRNFASKYIKPDQVRDGPIQTRIIHVFEG